MLLMLGDSVVSSGGNSGASEFARDQEGISVEDSCLVKQDEIKMIRTSNSIEE